MLNSDQIKTLQAALQTQGFLTPPGTVNGNWDAATATAWSAWGARHNVPPMWRRRQPECAEQTFGLVNTSTTEALAAAAAAEAAARQQAEEAAAAASAQAAAAQRAAQEAAELAALEAEEAAEELAAANAAAQDNAVRATVPATPSATEGKKGK